MLTVAQFDDKIFGATSSSVTSSTNIPFIDLYLWKKKIK